MATLGRIEWDEGTRVIRESLHTATRKQHECDTCGQVISLGERYLQLIALFRRFMNGGNDCYWREELQRSTIHERCINPDWGMYAGHRF